MSTCSFINKRFHQYYYVPICVLLSVDSFYDLVSIYVAGASYPRDFRSSSWSELIFVVCISFIISQRLHTWIATRISAIITKDDRQMITCAPVQWNECGSPHYSRTGKSRGCLTSTPRRFCSIGR